jgi:hypothetical protein
MTAIEKEQVEVKKGRDASIDKLWGKYYGPNAKHSKKHSKAADQMAKMKERMAAEKAENKKADHKKEPQAQPADKAHKQPVEKKPRVVTHELNKPAKEGSRNALMKQARALGIKYFRVMNRAELGEALKSGTTKERITAIAEGAKKRWQAGWKFQKKG